MLANTNLSFTMHLVTRCWVLLCEAYNRSLGGGEGGWRHIGLSKNWPNPLYSLSVVECPEDSGSILVWQGSGWVERIGYGLQVLPKPCPGCLMWNLFSQVSCIRGGGSGKGVLSVKHKARYRWWGGVGCANTDLPVGQLLSHGPPIAPLCLSFLEVQGFLKKRPNCF